MLPRILAVLAIVWVFEPLSQSYGGVVGGPVADVCVVGVLTYRPKIALCGRGFGRGQGPGAYPLGSFAPPYPDEKMSLFHPRLFT